MNDTNKSHAEFFSLIIPAVSDRTTFDSHINNVCTVLDEKIPGYYEIVAVENRGEDNPLDDWDHVKGEVLVIIDGDLSTQPTTLGDIVSAFEKGEDMAFAGQYADHARSNEPNLSYFAIRRSSLPRIHESPEGYKLILEVLGPETIKKLSPSAKNSKGHILSHLKKMIGIK